MSLLNFDYLKSVTGGDPGILKEIMQAYLVSLPPDMADLRKMVANGDMEGIRFQAHKIKSSLKIIGLPSADLFYQIEFSAKNNEDVESIPGKFHTADAEIEQALIEIREIVGA